MEITYLGHSSFRMKGKTATVITDPFDPKMVGIKYGKQSADIVTVSHQHEDHNKTELVNDVEKVINGPGEYEIKGVSVIGVQSYHDDKKGEERGGNVIYVYEIDELRVCHLGDLGHKLTEGKLEDLGDIDILFVPTGGVYTLDSTQALEAVRAIEPRITIPMHYKTKDINPEVFGELETEEAFLTEAGMVVERLPKLTVKKDDIGEDKKVVVLEIKQ